MSTAIVYPSEKYFQSFHAALSVVAEEQVYLEMVEAPTLEKVSQFQSGLILKNGPIYYAINDNQVVGWCDVFPMENPRLAHRGSLGMGLLPAYRGQGLGSSLLSAVLDHAKSFGIEKVELNVYPSNVAALALYRKFGFVQEGVIKNYRKLNGEYFDCIAMAKFL